MSATEGAVRLAREGAIARILLDRPAKHNAMTGAMTDTLEAICREIDADPDLRVAVIEGAGSRAFSAGSDIGSLGTYEGAWSFRQRKEYAQILLALQKPVIALLKGWVLGGGLEMALAADIRIAAPSARLGLPEVTHGWIPGGGGTQMLPRLVGYGQAMRLMLSGDPIPAEEALRIGLIEELVGEEELASRGQALAERIATHNPNAVLAVKASVRAALSTSLESGLRYEREINSLCFSGGHQEGIEAFKGRGRS